jgi:hypothetical protein
VYAAKVEKLDGKVVVPKMAVPKVGYFAVCIDTENNTFALWENRGECKIGEGAGFGTLRLLRNLVLGVI